MLNKKERFEKKKRFYGATTYSGKEYAFDGIPVLKFWKVHEGDYEGIKPDLYLVYKVDAIDEEGNKYLVAMHGIETENGGETYDVTNPMCVIPEEQLIAYTY